jgi:hypothetical protein
MYSHIEKATPARHTHGAAMRSLQEHQLPTLGTKISNNHTHNNTPGSWGAALLAVPLAAKSGYLTNNCPNHAPCPNANIHSYYYTTILLYYYTTILLLLYPVTCFIFTSGETCHETCHFETCHFFVNHLCPCIHSLQSYDAFCVHPHCIKQTSHSFSRAANMKPMHTDRTTRIDRTHCHVRSSGMQVSPAGLAGLSGHSHVHTQTTVSRRRLSEFSGGWPLLMLGTY